MEKAKLDLKVNQGSRYQVHPEEPHWMEEMAHLALEDCQDWMGLQGLQARLQVERLVLLGTMDQREKRASLELAVVMGVQEYLDKRAIVGLRVRPVFLDRKV